MTHLRKTGTVYNINGHDGKKNLYKILAEKS